jgi:PAS domain S-box-containing protein
MPIPDFEARFLANTPDGILFADETGIIRFWNAGRERLFGHSAAEAVGQSLDIIIPQAQRAPLARLRQYHAHGAIPLRGGRTLGGARRTQGWLAHLH